MPAQYQSLFKFPVLIVWSATQGRKIEFIGSIYNGYSSVVNIVPWVGIRQSDGCSLLDT